MMWNDLDDETAKYRKKRPKKPMTGEMYITHNYQGRVYKGWSIVGFDDIDIGYDARHTLREIDAWAAQNCEGEMVECMIGHPRRFFELSTDATLCYLTFR